MSRIIFSFIFILSLSSMALSDVVDAITSLVGRNAEGYLQPIGTMMGTGMNSGFYRKASPHKILGFDITLDLAYAMAPAGQTTYNFYIPEDSIFFPFQFQFPKNMFSSFTSDLSVIPTAESGNETLYQDQEIEFYLAVPDLLNAGDGDVRSQNILGNDSSTVLIVSLDKAIPTIFDQVVDNTWDIAKDINGIGKAYELVPGQTIQLYEDRDAFSSQFGDSIRVLIASGLGEMEMPELPIPGGFGDKFKTLPISIGMPLPIVQASVGLPFHTEITARGLPVAMPIGLGTVQYGGFGGKIGISDYLTDILYKSENEIRRSKSKDVEYIINAQPSDIKPKDVSKAISYLRLQEMDIHEIDSLNYIFGQGDPAIVIEIQNRMRDAQLQLESMPKAKKKKKKKKFPIDLALGYYTNDLVLDFSGAAINSTNRMISLQAGKTFNMPFIAWLGGIGLYGGIGFESSDLNIGYELANPLNYGCFTDATNDNYDSEIIDETSCINEYGASGWHSGVPQSISLSFPGDNKFRKLIGARMRILFLDAYVDYNMGTSNTINAGVGITIR